MLWLEDSVACHCSGQPFARHRLWRFVPVERAIVLENLLEILPGLQPRASDLSKLVQVYLLNDFPLSNPAEGLYLAHAQ